MIRKTFAAMVTGAVLAMPAGAMAQTWPVDWTISPRGAAEAGVVQLALSYRTPRGGHSMNSGPRQLSDLQGLSPSQLASDGSQVRFRIAREAGTLDCEGLVRRYRGTGECAFSPDPAFAAGLERRGIGRPTAEQQYQLAMSGVSLALVDELSRQGYQRPPLNKLVAAGIHGVSVPYVRSMAGVGYRLQDIDSLIKFRIHRVDADYVREVSAINPGTRYTADQLVAMRIHGITAATARQLAELGYRGLTHKQLVAMAIHGVSPSYIREMAAAGYRGLSPEQLVKMRIHRVTPEFAREMRAPGHAAPTPAELVSMRIHGVTARGRRR